MGTGLPAHQVLVTVGTPCTVSALGTTETTVARLLDDPSVTAFAAFDAGLVDLSPAGLARPPVVRAAPSSVA